MKKTYRLTIDYKVEINEKIKRPGVFKYDDKKNETEPKSKKLKEVTKCQPMKLV